MVPVTANQLLSCWDRDDSPKTFTIISNWNLMISDGHKNNLYPLVNVYILPWKITIFHGKIHEVNGHVQ